MICGLLGLLVADLWWSQWSARNVCDKSSWGPFVECDGEGNPIPVLQLGSLVGVVVGVAAALTVMWQLHVVARPTVGRSRATEATREP
jgi:hypothetical protein